MSDGSIVMIVFLAMCGLVIISAIISYTVLQLKRPTDEENMQ